MVTCLDKVILFLILISSSMLFGQVDQGLVASPINTSPLPVYDYDNLDYGMNIGMAQTPGGRIWAAWIGGGDNEDAFFVLNHSDDLGETWSSPKLVIDPHEPYLKESKRALVGNLWSDPKGNLWVFYDQGMTYFDGRAGLWAVVSNNPDDVNPKWSDPVRIWHGASLNKPIVLKDGTWMLPVSLWDRSKIKASQYKDAFHNLDSLRMAHVFVSKDEGNSWKRQGGVAFPEPKFDEHCLIEKSDGSIWMTARTNIGIWESHSWDKGLTWSPPQKYLPHISSRHFIRRLNSGNLLMVRHGGVRERTTYRSKLTAYLSKDEGLTWQGGLSLDSRRGVSYPDGFQSKDGMIYISYDRNRSMDGEILMATFTEEDILKGTFQDPRSRKEVLISKPMGLDKLAPPSEANLSKDLSEEEIGTWFEKGEWKDHWKIAADGSIDKASLAHYYAQDPKLWRKAFSFLKDNDLGQIKPGRYDLDGGEAYVLVMEYDTKKENETKYESHRNYADIQYVVQGVEQIGLVPLTDTKPMTSYDTANDIQYHKVKNDRYIEATNESFFIFFPGDAHRPSIKKGKSAKAKKIVVKVRVVENE